MKGFFPLTVLMSVLFSTYALAGAKSFGDDLAFLKKHTDVLVLSSKSGDARVAVVPAYQGRVMTSTATGESGPSFGWINRALIGSGKTVPHINVFGGEDRFWMGPEGGQFAIFFSKDAPFDLEHWQTPAVIDTEPYDIVSRSAESVAFRKAARIKNWSGSIFDAQIDRKIVLLSREQAADSLAIEIPKTVKTVVFETRNTLTNKGTTQWTRKSGLLSIWILGMFNPSPSTTVVLPFTEGPDEKLGPKVNDAYFGKVPADRLIVGNGVLYFRGDGEYRSKIGVSPKRAKPIIGSYDESTGLLTLVQYTKPKGARDYVNSMWELQDDPFSGDTVNSYNDGPPAPGKPPLGPFYELETSSPAKELRPGESMSHAHRTFHLQGPKTDMDKIARKALGVSLEDIAAAF